MLVGVLACSKTKALEPRPAVELYQGRTFRAAVDLRPGRFAVAAWRWCNWPKVARDELRAAALWTKVPGAMGTGFLDGATAERVRALVVQHGVTGLEELTENRT